MSTQTSLITGVDFVAIPVTDYDAATKFYGEVLGLPFVKRWGDMPAGEFQAGNLTLAVLQPDAFRDPDGNPLILHHRYAPKES